MTKKKAEPKQKDKPKGKHPGGRPTKYKAEYVDIVRGFYEMGATDEQVSKYLKVSIQTIFDWQAKYPEFLDAKKSAKEIPDQKVEQSLYNRAMGMVMEEEVVEEIEGSEQPGKKRTIRKQIPPDPTAMIFWLKNRKPKEWRDKQTIEHEVGEDTGLIILKGKTSVEEWQKQQTEK